MKPVAGIVVIALASAVPAAAAAEDFGIRIAPDGLGALERAAKSMVPERIEFEDLEAEALGCAIHLLEGSLDTRVEEVELDALRGALRGGLILDLEALAEVDICSGLMTCDIAASAEPVEAELEIALGASADEWLEVHDVDIDLSLPSRGFDIAIENCDGGDFLSMIGEALVQLIAPLAADRVGDRLTEVLADALPRHIETENLVIDLGLERLDIHPEIGLDLAGWASVRYSGPRAGEPEGRDPEGDPLPRDFGPGDIAIAASDRLVNRVLHGAWRAGMLEAALGDLTPTVPLSEDGFAQQLGLPEGSEIDVHLALGAAPELAFSREGEGVAIRLDRLAVEVAVNPPGRQGNVIEVAADAYLAADLAMRGDGGLALDPRALDITHLWITGGSSELSVDPARLEVFLQDVAVPLLAERLADLPLAPALAPADGLYVWMRQIEAEGGWLRAGLDLVLPDPDDFEPPKTRLVDPPEKVAAGLTRIRVTGEDDTTPPPLLRYEVSIDGVPVTSEPEFMTAIPVSLADGEYMLEVRAVDLAGNVERHPLRHLLVVDGVPPTLEILEAPDHTTGTTARASWRATDDRGVPTTRWELFEVGADGAAREVLREGEAGPEGEVELRDLRRGAHYVLRIKAIDEAGNVTSRDFGFAGVSSGCAAAGKGGLGSALAVLAAVMLVSSRRLRRFGPAVTAGIVAVGFAALATPASAQGIGTHASGPTDADGAAAFWNPAAMFRAHGNHLYAASGLSLIRIDFDADQAGSSRTFVPKPEPTIGAFTDAPGRDWRLGFTVGAPQIDGATWRRDDGAGDITRYYAASAQYVHVAATTTAAYRASPYLAVGGGLRFVRSHMTADLDRDMGSALNMTLGSSEPDAPFPFGEPALAAPTELRATGWGIGLVAGALFTPPAPVVIGLGIHSPSTSKASGRVGAEYPDELREFVADAEPNVELPELAGDVRADLDMPLMVFSAIAYEPAPRWELALDYRFLGRSTVPNTDVIVTEATSDLVSDTAVVRGYRNRHSLGARASHRIELAPVLAALRVRYESNSVPEETMSPSNVDFHKIELGGAAIWSITPRVDVIGQYSRFILARRSVDDSLNRPLAEPSLAAFNKPSPTGSYRGVSDYLAFGVSTTW